MVCNNIYNNIYNKWCVIINYIFYFYFCKVGLVCLSFFLVLLTSIAQSTSDMRNPEGLFPNRSWQASEFLTQKFLLLYTRSQSKQLPSIELALLAKT